MYGMPKLSILQRKSICYLHSIGALSEEDIVISSVESEDTDSDSSKDLDNLRTLFNWVLCMNCLFNIHIGQVKLRSFMPH